MSPPRRGSLLPYAPSGETEIAWRIASSWPSPFAGASLGQPILPAERQEDADAELGLNVVGERLFAEPVLRVALLRLRVRNLRVLELLDVDVVADFHRDGEPPVQ